MKRGNIAPNKPPLAQSGRDCLAFVFMAAGLVMLFAFPRHSAPHDAGFAGIFAGSAVKSVGTYRFPPSLLFALAALLGAVWKTLETPSLVLMALAIVIGVYGWWRSRRAKVPDEGAA